MPLTPFQHKILSWYTKNKRDLPWRRTTNPYKILVSEVMSQQTHVGRVIPKYRAFLRKFPTSRALASASPGNVLLVWSGLGYNRRALYLQQACQRIATEHGGIFPQDTETLLTLPGIGPYTAAAICSFAFNQDVACIDTNIRRILIHELSLPETISLQDLKKIARHHIPKGKSREWHNALMDYGALYLTAKRTHIKSLSTHPPFKDSRRYYRGQLLKSLTRGEHPTLVTLAARWNKDVSWIHQLMITMRNEGLITLSHHTIKLP